jgi:hypothetical protein
MWEEVKKAKYVVFPSPFIPLPQGERTRGSKESIGYRFAKDDSLG